MIRLLCYAVLVVGLAAGAVYFAERPGQVTVQWMGVSVTTSVGVLLATAAVIFVVTSALYRVWHAMRRGPAQWKRERAVRRQEQGYRTLTQGLVAVAAGDPKTAQRLGKKAGKLTNDPVCLLLQAQASQLEGDHEAAHEFFTKMLDNPETEFLGRRGLLVEATRNGEWQLALEHARRAYALRPETPWVNTALFELEARAGNWSSAQKTMENAVKRKIVKPQNAPRQKAVVMTERALAAKERGHAEEALSLAREAHGLAPDLVPATALAADLLIAAGRGRAAAGILMEGWKRQPHPDFTCLFAAIAPDETPVRRVQRFQFLIKRNPEHEESDLAVAEAAVAAKFWDTARTHLERLSGKGESQRYYRLMARLAEDEKEDAEAARQWMQRAQGAPADPAWSCDNCGIILARWRARCGACGTFDSLSWRTADSARSTSAVSNRLPLFRDKDERPEGDLVDAGGARQ